MTGKRTVGGSAAVLTIVALLLGPARPTAAEDAPPAGDRIVPPSEYVEESETPGKTGGTDEEADAAEAQAEAAKAAAPSPPAEPRERAAAIATDLIIGRPTSLMATVAGSAFFALSLPITASTGRTQVALERFVTEPANRLIAPLGR
jgi:hypothetical protein